MLELNKVLNTFYLKRYNLCIDDTWCEQMLSQVSRKWWLTWIGPEVPNFNSNGDQYIVEILFVIIISSSIYFVILRYAGYLSNPHNSKDNKQLYVYMRKNNHS